MIPTIKFLLLFLSVLLFCSACGESNDASPDLSNQPTQSAINIDSIIDFENSKNKWQRSTIYLHSRIKSDSNFQYERRPTIEKLDLESNSFVLNYEWESGPFRYPHELFIEVLDKSKLELNKTYEIPNRNIRIKVAISGLFSSGELYKNVKGTLRFVSLQDDLARIKLDLIGDLSQINKQEDAEIFKGELNILKDYSCYEGYAPENKLGINLDSIRELEAAKNNDWSGTNLIARAKVTTRELEKIGPEINWKIDSSRTNSLVLVNRWRPAGGYNTEVYIEIFDTSKIKLGKEYTIPNDLFDVHASVQGHMRGSELFENLTGTIKFDRIHEDYTEAKLLLKGDGGKPNYAKNALIIDDKLYFLKGFSWRPN